MHLTCILTPPLKGFLLELGTGVRAKKPIMMELPGRERSLTLSSAVWIQYTNVTDRQTDRRTGRHRSTAKTTLTHSVAR